MPGLLAEGHEEETELVVGVQQQLHDEEAELVVDVQQQLGCSEVCRVDVLLW